VIVKIASLRHRVLMAAALSPPPDLSGITPEIMVEIIKYLFKKNKYHRTLMHNMQNRFLHINMINFVRPVMENRF
jgi:hypothetical protein